MFSKEVARCPKSGKVGFVCPKATTRFCGGRCRCPTTPNTPKKHESVRKEWDGAAARACQLAFTRTHCEPKMTQREQKYGN